MIKYRPACLLFDDLRILFLLMLPYDIENLFLNGSVAVKIKSGIMLEIQFYVANKYFFLHVLIPFRIGYADCRLHIDIANRVLV